MKLFVWEDARKTLNYGQLIDALLIDTCAGDGERAQGGAHGSRDEDDPSRLTSPDKTDASQEGAPGQQGHSSRAPDNSVQEDEAPEDDYGDEDDE